MRDICSSPVMNWGGRRLFSLKYSYTALRYSGLFIGFASLVAAGVLFAVSSGLAEAVPCISPVIASAFFWVLVLGTAFAPPLTRLSRAAARSAGKAPRC